MLHSLVYLLSPSDLRFCFSSIVTQTDSLLLTSEARVIDQALYSHHSRWWERQSRGFDAAFGMLRSLYLLMDTLVIVVAAPDAESVDFLGRNFSQFVRTFVDDTEEISMDSAE
jgi:hypothetical protein